MKRGLLERTNSRFNLTDFARAVGYEPAAHHELLIRELQALSDGTNRRLIVTMPPGSAKSTYGSILFPVWWFSRHRTSSVLAASHTAELAEHFARRARALVTPHADILGYKLAAADRAAARWRTTDGGQYFATGVRGPIAGRRADLAIIDDPIRNLAEADSKLVRDQLWDWFRADLTSRMKPRGRIALITTRWHEDDLAGRLLAEQSDLWRALRLPALADADDDPLGRALGAPIWPQWEDEAALLAKRTAVGPRVWGALYQQDPRPLDGGLFRANRLAALTAPPILPPDAAVRAWDLAATAAGVSRNPDWTVGLKLARDEAGRFIVLDIIRLRGERPEVEHAIAEAARADGLAVPIGLPQDPGSAGKSYLSHLVAMLAGYRVVASRETGNKQTRAGAVAAQVAVGNLALAPAAWNRAFVEELQGFPHASHDDQVDALARAFTLLIERPKPVRRLISTHLQR